MTGTPHGHHTGTTRAPHRHYTGTTQAPHRHHTGTTQAPHRYHTGTTQAPHEPHMAPHRHHWAPHGHSTGFAAAGGAGGAGGSHSSLQNQGISTAPSSTGLWRGHLMKHDRYRRDKITALGRQAIKMVIQAALISSSADTPQHLLVPLILCTLSGGFQNKHSRQINAGI